MLFDIPDVCSSTVQCTFFGVLIYISVATLTHIENIILNIGDCGNDKHKSMLVSLLSFDVFSFTFAYDSVEAVEIQQRYGSEHAHSEYLKHTNPLP